MKFQKKILFEIFIVTTLIWISLNTCSILCVNNEKGSKNQVNLTADEDRLDISFEVEGPNVLKKDVLNIINVEVEDTETNATVGEDDVKVHEYHVYKDKKGEEEVLSGDLEWNADSEVWEKKNIKLSWTGNGYFYVTVEFQTKDMDESQETRIKDDFAHKYNRQNLLEIFLIVLLFVGIGIGVLIIFLVVHWKKQGLSVERKVKEPKEGIKIKEISKGELKKPSKKEKSEKTEKKEKGKTEVKEDLIFSVPKWEEDDEK